MTNNNVIQRVVLFIIAIPSIIAVIFLLPHQKHVIINMVGIIISYLATKELIHMLENKGISLKSKVIPYLSIPLPLVSYLMVRFELRADLFSIVLTTIIIFILLISISTKKSNLDFSNNITFISSSIFVVLYPSYFISYIIRLSEFQNSSLIICYFIIIVFLNDSGAWLLGVLFGKNNRGIVKVSVNKSVMGFVGGTIGTFIFMGFARYFIPRNIRLNRFSIISSTIFLLHN
ncbi:MAG: hypothetical protein B6229_03865 [Spirochaetaceae bacterium 4572_7]|nr:MAG: hypothetical protein B6229_03865 [Spirochaetaceae bacterium 4572_7]